MNFIHVYFKNRRVYFVAHLFNLAVLRPIITYRARARKEFVKIMLI